jgi:hypothetical protein
LKVAIFETEHFEAAYPLLRLFDNGRNEITIFCYPAPKKQLDHMLKEDSQRYRWVVKGNNQSRISFIRTMNRELKKEKTDLLYLNTLSDNYFFYALLVMLAPVKRVVLTLHALNNFFTSTRQYRPKKWLNAIGKRLLRSRIKEYTVLSQAMVPQLQQRLGKNRKVYCVPGSIFEKQEQRIKLQNPIHLVVPGSIDGKRRSYSQAFEVLYLCRQENIPVHMTFLGRFCGEYGQTILDKCREWNKEENNLSYYSTEEIEQPEFDRVVESADFLFNPSVVHTIMDGVAETYGVTISSGNMSDVIRHSRPLIIPAALIIDPAFEQSCIRYNHPRDILSYIQLVRTRNEPYRKLAEAAFNASQSYTVEKIRVRNQELLTG